MATSVYVISTTHFMGGGEVFLLRLAELVGSTIRLVVVSPSLTALEAGLIQCGGAFLGLGVRGWVRWNILRWLWTCRRELRSGPAVVVLNGRGAAYLAPFVRLLTGLAPVIIRHTCLSPLQGDLKEAVYRLATRFARRVVAVSDHVAAEHARRWPDLDVVSIPNWFFAPTPALPDKARIRALDATLRAAVVARLEPGKGVEDVAAACAKDAGIELHVYGDGAMAGRLRALYKNSPSVHWEGHVDDLSSRLTEDVILILGSYSESFSYALGEGALAGLLCVVTDIPAHRELLGDDYPRTLFFPPGDQVALRRSLQAARRLLCDGSGEGARRAIAGARDRILHRNSPDAARERYLAVFSAAGGEDAGV